MSDGNISLDEKVYHINCGFCTRSDQNIWTCQNLIIKAKYSVENEWIMLQGWVSASKRPVNSRLDQLR